MKITFTAWRWINGTITRIVNVQENKDGYWRKRSQRALIKALKETKGVEIKEVTQ